MDGKTGKPAKAAVTSHLWVTKNGHFAQPSANNKVRPFLTGKDYFADLIIEIGRAQTEVCIAGWQINWDALLARGVRLYDVLHDLLTKNKKVIVYLMPWSHSLPVETYDGQTVRVFKQLNEDLNTQQIKFVQSPSYSSAEKRYFAHHQKFVVIDRRIAYVGGMDVCYGRYDDETYDLTADAEGREAMNRYNGCVAQVLAMSTEQLVDPDLFVGPRRAYISAVGNWRNGNGLESDATKELRKLRQPGHWQMKYAMAPTRDTVINAKALASDAPDPTTLDPKRQPRMPWQDVHCRLDGPAVNDVLRNFVLRWNIEADKADRMVLTQSTFASEDSAGAQCFVQVLRSAPGAQVKKEIEATPSAFEKGQSAETQDDIYSAICLLIEKSRRFIYIENQFFVSAFGQEAPHESDRLSSAAQFIDRYPDQKQSQNSSAALTSKASSKGHFVGSNEEALHPPTNQVCQTLLKRVDAAIQDKERPYFHVYITLPVHSEGTLSSAFIAVQVYWTMQTLVYGSNSLLNGIRRSLKARELRDEGDKEIARIYLPESREYESIPIEACFEYVTLLNLRNWLTVDERYLSEHVYVHTKLLIADDRYALLGSANINERSMLGDRDSEIAVLVADGEVGRADVNGTGSKQMIRGFAHDLRKQVWRKLFGITGKVRPADHLAQVIDQPGSPDSWRTLQAQAKANAALYEAAFPWVPRNTVKDSQGVERPASILSTWDKTAPAPSKAVWGEAGNLLSPLPFQPEFWDLPRHTAEAKNLGQIKGFFTALPIQWCKDEFNRFQYPTALVTEVTEPQTVPGAATIRVASGQEQKHGEEKIG